MRIELMSAENVIRQEIEAGAKQKSVALTYAMAIVSSYPTDWAKVNGMIRDRWSQAGLTRVKTMAWKMIQEQQSEADPAHSTIG